MKLHCTTELHSKCHSFLSPLAWRHPPVVTLPSWWRGSIVRASLILRFSCPQNMSNLGLHKSHDTRDSRRWNSYKQEARFNPYGSMKNSLQKRKAMKNVGGTNFDVLLTVHLSKFNNRINITSTWRNMFIQGDSVARGPKLLSIKNYVIEIMTWKWKMKMKKRCKTGPSHNRCWNWSPFTSKHTWMRFSKF